MELTTSSFLDRIDHDRIVQCNLSTTNDSVPRSVDAVIGAIAINRVAVRRKKGKAPGNNCIVAELQTYLPEAMSRVLWL